MTVGARAGRGRAATALVLIAAAVSLWVLRSALIEVYAEMGDVAGLDSRWLVAILGCEAAAFVSVWVLNRVALRTDRWFDVAVAQLAGNAASNVVPGGGPAGAAVQLRVLSEAGFDLTSAAASLGALSLLGAMGLLVLPVAALPFAVLAGPSDRSLQAALLVGVGLLVLVLLVGRVLWRGDASLERMAAVVQWAGNLWRPRPARRRDLPVRVLGERDAIRAAFREQPVRVLVAAVGRSAGDCAALYFCLLAVGAHPSALVVLIAFGAANVAGMVPITPGGLGFVEAGITATLVTAGIDSEHALLAAAAYRLANTWLPVVLGLVGYLVFRRRRRSGSTQSLSAIAAGDDEEATAGHRSRRGSRRSTVVVVTALALVLVAPVLGRVYGRAGATFTLGPAWLLAIAAMIVIHFVSAWALYRVVLRTSDRFDIAASHLAGNAASHVVPVGSAVGAGIQFRMLTIAGFPTTQAVTALGATAVVGTVAGYVVLPVVVLISSAVGGGVAPRLVTAMWSAAAVLVMLLIAGAVAFARDRPWRSAARAAAWTGRRLRRELDAHELSDRLIHERDLIRGAVRQRAGYVMLLAVVQPLADYAALYLALLAAGAHVNPIGALAAFIVSNVAGLIPLTPGGLGFVEAGLTGVLVIAGARRPDAHVAVVTYRLAATWLPCLAGGVALVLFQHRHRERTLRELVVAPAKPTPS